MSGPPVAGEGLGAGPRPGRGCGREWGGGVRSWELAETSGFLRSHFLDCVKSHSVNTSQDELRHLGGRWAQGGRVHSQDWIWSRSSRGSSLSRLQTTETEAQSLGSFPDVTQLVSEAGSEPVPEEPPRSPLLLVTPTCEPEPSAGSVLQRPVGFQRGSCRALGRGCCLRLMALAAGESLPQTPGLLSTWASRDQTGRAPCTHTGHQPARPRSVHTSSLCGRRSPPPGTWGCSRGWQLSPGRLGLRGTWGGPPGLEWTKAAGGGTLGFWLPGCAPARHEFPEAWPWPG